MLIVKAKRRCVCLAFLQCYWRFVHLEKSKILHIYFESSYWYLKEKRVSLLIKTTTGILLFHTFKCISHDRTFHGILIFIDCNIAKIYFSPIRTFKKLGVDDIIHNSPVSHTSEWLSYASRKRRIKVNRPFLAVHLLFTLAVLRKTTVFLLRFPGRRRKMWR